MKRFGLVAALTLVCSLQARAEGLARLDFLIGEWNGTTRGEPGEGKTHRVCAKVLDERYIECRNTTTYPAQEKNPKGEVHVDVAYFSYDKSAKKLRLRQFHGEGFVNGYVETDALVFETVEIENIPAGWRARETYEQSSPNVWTERFELAEPGKNFAIYSSATLQRVR